MFGIGMQELVVILLIALLLFGGSRLPEVGRSLGKAIGEFKNAIRELSSNSDDKTPKA